MEIAFDDKTLRSLCERAALAEAKFGPFVAQKLRSRLSDIQAASTLMDLPFSDACAVSWKNRECYCFMLGEGHAMLVGANHVRPPIESAGRMDWSAVKRVKVLLVGIYVE